MQNLKIKKEFIFLILLVIPIVQAGNYGEGRYGVGDYSIGEVPEEVQPSSVGTNTPVERGKIKKITEEEFKCYFDKDCGKNKYCFENECYEAECTTDSVCNVEEGEVCWNYRCVKLFDVEIKEFESPINLGDFFDFTYLIKGMADINNDVEVSFWIGDKENKITSGQDTIYIGSFEEKIKTT